jgi:hypothetical protein
MIEKPSPMARITWDGWYYCEGRLLGVSKPYGRSGQRLDHRRPTHARMPAGMAYVGSHNPNSFDSAISASLRSCGLRACSASCDAGSRRRDARSGPRRAHHPVGPAGVAPSLR